MPQSFLFGLVNDIWLWSTAIAAIAVTLYALKGVAVASDTKQDFCRRLLKLFKAVGALQLVCALVLASRINVATAATSYTDPAALVGGRWCLIRAAAGVVCGLCVLLSHAHHAFRWFALVVQPFAACADLVSELYFVASVNCMRRGLCTYDASQIAWGSAFALRDLISAAFAIAGTIMCASLTYHLGALSTMPLPVVEEREFTKPLERKLARPTGK